MRRSAADTEFAFGPDHQETAMSYMSLAISARNAGHLVEAGEAMQRAVGIAQGLRLRAVDRIELERTMALIDHDLGHYEAARARLLALERADSIGRRARTAVAHSRQRVRGARGCVECPAVRAAAVAGRSAG